MRRFLIDTNIEFSPELRLISSEDEEVKLHSSCVYCLELLIEHQGEIVEHEELYNYAWRRFGMEVSSNALYQSISMLRKALFKCGNQNNIIITVPRRGFSLSGKVLISQRDAQESSPKQVCESMNKSDGMQAIHEEDRIEEISYANSHDKKDVDINTVGFHAKKNERINSIIYVTLILFITLFMAFPARILLFNDERYVKQFEFNGCDFYSNVKFEDNSTIVVALRTEMKCHSRKNVYVTYSQEGHRISVIKCLNKISSMSSPNCLSYYYIGNPW